MKFFSAEWSALVTKVDRVWFGFVLGLIGGHRVESDMLAFVCAMVLIIQLVAAFFCVIVDRRKRPLD